ncbi:MAG: helix-turn-helix transcriptional regulator [Bacteroidota bacterium]
MKNKNTPLLEEVLACIADYSGDSQFGVETICQRVGLSERQLQRKLKQVTDKTPNQLIRSVRLNRAKEMLLSEPAKIADIALQTGFLSPSYFSKCFKKEFGVSPSDFLQQMENRSEVC